MLFSQLRPAASLTNLNRKEDGFSLPYISFLFCLANFQFFMIRERYKERRKWPGKKSIYYPTVRRNRHTPGIGQCLSSILSFLEYFINFLRDHLITGNASLTVLMFANASALAV